MTDKATASLVPGSSTHQCCFLATDQFQHSNGTNVTPGRMSVLREMYQLGTVFSKYQNTLPHLPPKQIGVWSFLSLERNLTIRVPGFYTAQSNQDTFLSPSSRSAASKSLQVLRQLLKLPLLHLCFRKEAKEERRG